MPYQTMNPSLSGQFDPYQYMMQMQNGGRLGLNGAPGPLAANGGAAMIQNAPPIATGPQSTVINEPAAAGGGMNPMMMMALANMAQQGGGGGQQQMQPPPPVMPQGPGPTVQAPGGNPEPMQRAMAALQRLQEMRRGAGQPQQQMRPPMFGGGM